VNSVQLPLALINDIAIQQGAGMLSRKLFAVMILTVAFLAVLPLSGVLASGNAADVQPQSKTPPEVLGPNLLVNPGLEGSYHQQCSRRSDPPWVSVPCDPNNYDVGNVNLWATAQVPDGWNAWWRIPNDNQKDPNYFNTYPAYCDFSKTATPFDCIPWHNPEFRDTLGGPQEYGPSRKVAGDNAQKYFTFYTIHEAGLYQQVGGVKPGDRLRFSIFMEAWSSGANDPSKSDLGQRMNLQVGIDPTGGNDPWSPNIIWTAPAESYDRFSQFVVEAVAKNNVVSVWTKSRPNMPLQHVDVYVDEGSLNVVQGAKPTTKAPAKSTRVITSTKIITTTRQITGTDGIVYTALITQSVIVTRTVAVTTTQSTKPVTTTKPVTPTKPVTSTTSVTGTLPIPASGKYTVQQGDSLSKIARRFGIKVAVLLELNKNLIKDPNRIEPGWVLRLK
jgi:LysM repeat protein